MLEPSDSQEAKDFIGQALDISEEYDTPVIVRSTTRISHSRSLVSTSPRKEVANIEYQKDPQKYVMIPAFGRIRHKVVLERWENLKKLSSMSKLNQVHNGDGLNKKTGIITSGVLFQYAMEVFPDIDILKLGMTSPIPEDIIREFAQGKKTIVIIEELEPYLEEKLLSMDLGIRIIGKELFPLYGELSPGFLRKVSPKVTGKKQDSTDEAGQDSSSVNQAQEGLPLRPPVLCAGCPHRPAFHVIKKLRLKVMGDIGCYTLSVLPPLNSLDSCLCMGAGIGQALGMEKADPALKGKVVSVIGDSTFFHSGMTPLVDNLYNKGTGVIIILDNRITAMTGHQVHPGVGKTLMGEETVTINPEDIAKGAGIENVEVVDPYDMKAFEDVLRKHLKVESLSVIVARQKCVLLDRKKPKVNKVFIDQDKCEKCGLCIKFGCPAIELKDETYSISSLQCSGCGVCVGICRKDAIICKSSS
jgi:indolepyruvate ferredoxin oxidoreductase alpha subunit